MADERRATCRYCGQEIVLGKRGWRLPVGSFTGYRCAKAPHGYHGIRNRRGTFGPARQAWQYEQLADTSGYVCGISAVLNEITGEFVPLPKPIRVHLSDVDGLLTHYRRRFAEEWNAAHPNQRMSVP